MAIIINIHNKHAMCVILLFTFSLCSLTIQAREAVPIKLAFPDKVQYILKIPNASVADTGYYECAVTNQFTRETKSISLGITVHGSSLSHLDSAHLCFHH